MPIVPLALPLQSSPGRYGPDSAGQLINAYAEKAGEGGKAQFPVYPIEGLASFATLTGGSKYRGGISLNAYGYVVSGPLLHKVDNAGAVTLIGGFPGSEPVFMARNRKSAGAQIALVSDGLRYICELDVLTAIADTDLPASNSVVYLDGYFIFTQTAGTFFITSIDEGTAIDALDFATAEANPDGIVCAYTRGREVVFFGQKSIEFWINTGAAAFPFERNDGVTVQNMGLLCQHSVKDLNDIVFFIASDGTVRLLNGYEPERISTHDVERDIDAVTDKGSITAEAYSIRGHQFYTISCDDWTWSYDGLTGLWHQRMSYGEDRWIGEGFVEIDGKRVVGDHEDGLLYQIDPATYTEASGHLVWKIITPPMHAYPNRAIVNRLFLDLIPGVGLNSSDEHLSDPKVMLRWSDDGGKTWSNERTASVGEIGETKRRVVFGRLGTTGEDGRIYEISMSSAVIRGITGAAVDVDLLEP